MSDRARAGCAAGWEDAIVTSRLKERTGSDSKDRSECEGKKGKCRQGWWRQVGLGRGGEGEGIGNRHNNS